MSEESKIGIITAQVKSRREFVKTAAKVAVTAPAAALLLNASVKPAKARVLYDPKQGQFGDDAQLYCQDADFCADDFIGFANGDDGFF
jgi:hypothetical protein